jgi:hypothetical protein
MDSPELLEALARAVEDAALAERMPVALELLLDDLTHISVRVPIASLTALLRSSGALRPRHSCNGAANGQAVPPPPPPSAAPSLSGVEEELLHAFRGPNELLTAQEICDRSGIPYNSHARVLLSNLGDRGILRATSKGYRLALGPLSDKTERGDGLAD